MKQGELLDRTPEASQQSYMELMEKARTYLTRSVSMFEEVDDSVNLALIYCNMGRYHRQMADMLSWTLQGNVKTCEMMYQKYYTDAFSCYNRALAMLEVRKKSPQIWDILNWELSTATFIRAQKMQDFWDGSGERYQEIMELLQRSLKLCQTHSDEQRTADYLYRTGQINTRLAMVCREVVRSQSWDEKKRKNMMQLCTFYYEKAISIFRGNSHLSECLEVQTDLLDFTSSQIDYGTRIKALQYTMNVMKQIKEILEMYNGSDDQLRALEAQYQTIFKNLLRVAMTRGVREKELNVEFLNATKQIYSVSLRGAKEECTKLRLLRNISSILDIYFRFNFSKKQLMAKDFEIK